MWQVGTSFRLLRAETTDVVHRPWVDQVRSRFTAAGLDRGWLAALFQASGYVPDFLNPAAPVAHPTLADELAMIRATPDHQIRQDLDHLRRHQGGDLGRRLRILNADPATLMARVTKEIESYWHLALAPYWDRIRSVLDADVSFRACQIAEHGAGHLFNDLHPTISWNEDALRMVRRHHALSRKSAGPGLLLIPSAFKGSGLSTLVAPPGPPQIAYRARGVGTLWVRRTATGASAISAVLGRTRGRLLTELETPATTTELAHRTGISMAGVSQNLMALRKAGLVTAHRIGRSVLYARTSISEALLTGGGGASEF